MNVVRQSILLEPFAAEQARVEQRLHEIMSAARREAIDELESYHAFGPKFTKFDEEFDAEIVDLKIDVFGPVALTTFVMEYGVVTPEGERLSFRARATMVFADDDGQWLIVHEHFSPFVANS